MATRVRQNKRVFVIGAGMSKECGAPLTNDFLKSPFIDIIKKKDRELIFEFIKTNSLKKELNIEDLLSYIDNEIQDNRKSTNKKKIELRVTRLVLLQAITKILTSIHSKLLETFELFHINPRFENVADKNLLFLKELFGNQSGWIESLLEGLPTSCKSAAKLIRVLATYKTLETLKKSLVSFFKKYESERLCTAHADCIAKLIFTKIELKPEHVYDEFLTRLEKLNDKHLSPVWLGSGYNNSGEIIANIFWLIYLLRSEKERICNLQGWYNTYYSFVQKLKKGDTVITLNYDLFLELALLCWKKRQGKYGVSWGTQFYEFFFDNGLEEVPGNPENYARDYFEKQGGVEYFYKVKKSTEKENGNVRKKEAESNYKRFLKEYRNLKNSNNWVHILKLHGSLNWGICESCNKLLLMMLEPFDEAKSIILRNKEYNEAFKRNYLCCDQPKLKPLLVPPTFFKDYDHKILAGLWSNARKRLEEANSIIFLGYSLPGLDLKIQHLFKKAKINRNGNPWEEVLVVNKSARDEELIDRYKEVFGKVKPIQRIVSSYLHSLRVLANNLQ